MKNKSYQQIFDTFNEMYPEFKRSVKDWGKCQFDNEIRMVRISLKNGCYICFGTIRDEDNKWVWVANICMSEKTKEKLEVAMEE